MIRVSDITVYHKCPRMCYFNNKGLAEKSAGYLERLILKELALTYASAFKSDEKLTLLNGELDRISNEIRVIYRNELSGIDDETIARSVSDIRALLPDIVSNLPANSNFFEGEVQYDEPLLKSEKFGISGAPDRLVKINEELVPSMIKTGSIPENGVWQGDRLQLTAYSVLVEENYNSIVKRGFVEYARQGKVREVIIKRQERRKVLQIAQRIKKIHSGFMPEKPEGAPCKYCGFTELCDVKSTLASRFF